MFTLDNIRVRLYNVLTETNYNIAYDNTITILDSLAHNIKYFQKHTYEISQCLSILYIIKNIVKIGLDNRIITKSEGCRFISLAIILIDELESYINIQAE